MLDMPALCRQSNLQWDDLALEWEERILSDQIDKGMKQFLSDPLFSAENPHKRRK